MKNSKLNIIFTLIGVLFVIGALVGSFFAFISYISNSLTGLLDDDEYFFNDSNFDADDISIVEHTEN